MTYVSAFSILVAFILFFQDPVVARVFVIDVLKPKEFKIYDDYEPFYDSDDIDYMKIKDFSSGNIIEKVLGPKVNLNYKQFAQFEQKQPSRFSQDYYDVQQSARTNNNMYDFSNDYMDFSDMWRSGPKIPNCKEFPNRKECVLLERRSRKQRKHSDSYESDEDSLEDNLHKRNPSRFNVVSKYETKPTRYQKKDKETVELSSEEKESSASIESEYESVSESEEKKSKKIKKSKTNNYKLNDEYSVLQGNKVYNDWYRRRLPYFLPKRVRWNQDDIHELGYYWFNGPKGVK